MNNHHSSQLIDKYLEGKCTEEELQDVIKWYNSFPDKKIPEELLNDKSRLLLKNRMRSKIRVVHAAKKSASINVEAILKASITMAAAIIIALLIILPNGNQQKHKDGIALLKDSKLHSLQNTTLTLMKKVFSDGSEIWLSPGTKIEFPKVFTAKQRDVNLYGEAFFQVTPDKNRPFIIHSGEIETRVWGTSFRIRNYPGLPAQVNVIAGRVSVKLAKQKDNGIMLIADESAVLGLKSSGLQKSKKKTDNAMEIWHKVSLSFSDSPVTDVISQLNNHFDCDIIISDKVIESYALTADFNEQNLADILDMLRKSLNIDYVMDGTKIKLISK
ncbi:FecR family protein [Pedobacter sp.]|uniref:FecR family protein n=1 Tax=Pedobacter sp. TaxID=1411316 RepID=UPI003BA98257